MKLRLIITLLVATLAYTVAILVGLILRLSLSKILVTGLMALISFAFFSWFMIYFLQIYAGKKGMEQNLGEREEGQTKNNKSLENDMNSNSNNTESGRRSRIETEEDFKPLNPPFLEVNDETRGEGSK